MHLTVVLLLVTLVCSQGQDNMDTELKAAEVTSNFGLYPMKLWNLTEYEFTVYKMVTNMQTLNHNATLQKAFLRYLNDYESSSALVDEEVNDAIYTIMNNPILAFRMLYRYVRDLPQINEAHHLLNSYLEGNQPQECDIEEAMSGLNRLAFTYDLDLSEFASGDIHGIKTRWALQPRHIFAIGKHTLEEGIHHALAVEWLELTREELNKGDIVDTTEIDEAELNRLIELAVSTHDKLYATTKGYSNKFFVRKIVPRLDIPYEFDGWVRRWTQRSRELDTYGGIKERDYHEINMWGLCSGELGKFNVENELYCWYDTRLPLFPFKVELVAKAPRLIQIHSFIGESMIDGIIASAEPLMQRSKVEHKTEADPIVSGVRTSYTCWIHNHRCTYCDKLEALIESATGLNIRGDSSEPLQAATYTTFGAHYEFHLDEEDAYLNHEAARFATFMIYLTEPEAGGGTAFLDAHVTVKPSRGSAVFWHDLDRAGNVDFNTHHAACPVLLGTKWVANKWIKYNSQYDVRKCQREK